VSARTAEADRAFILDVVLRYCRGVDRLDMALVRSAYHPGAIDHHTGFSGIVDDYIAWISAGLRRLDGTMHIVGNHLVQLSGDVAVAETYGTAVHWGQPADEPRMNFTSGFRYVDLMTFEEEHWAIRERWAVREWTRSDAGRFITKEATGPAGSRDGDDPLYGAQKRAADLAGAG
jgi:SnoaL-like domain